MNFLWPSALKQDATFGVRLGRALHWLWLAVAAGVVIFTAGQMWSEVAGDPCGPFGAYNCRSEYWYMIGRGAVALVIAFGAASIGRLLRYVCAGE